MIQFNTIIPYFNKLLNTCLCLLAMYKGYNWGLASFNPLMLRAAKRGLMILNIFYLQKHFLENI